MAFNSTTQASDLALAFQPVPVVKLAQMNIGYMKCVVRASTEYKPTAFLPDLHFYLLQVDS